MSETKVVQLRKRNAAEEAQGAFSKRWGTNVADHGYTMVPAILLAMGGRLKLHPTQMLVLLKISSFWWQKESLPWPSKEKIAVRVGITERQVQRILRVLETAGLIKRLTRRYKSGGQSSNAYDLSGLVNRLRKLEPEYRQMKEEHKARRAEVETPVSVRLRRKAGSPPASK